MNQDVALKPVNKYLLCAELLAAVVLGSEIAMMIRDIKVAGRCLSDNYSIMREQQI
ncbi:hypothetical protein MRY16398_33350 [Phytobacter sp. MRY16-398]|nr:hypothetical protein MRY16398_33350 [Phytobacter sp. MRY16-398]